jgi:hypothetical protein
MAEEDREATGPVALPPEVDPPPRVVRVWYPRTHAGSGPVVGAGIIVDGEPLVVTCAHVAARALNGNELAQAGPTGWLKVDFPSLDPDSAGAARRSRAYVAYWVPAEKDGGGDLAWLALEGNPPVDVKPAPLRDLPALNSKLEVFGFTKGTPSGDWADAKLGRANFVGWRQLNPLKLPGRRIQPGFSGAAVLSAAAGGVVGMVVAADQLERDDRVSYAIPATTLHDRLSELQKQGRLPKPPLVDLDPPPEVAPLIRALDALEAVRTKLVLADNPWTLQARLPQVLNGLHAVEAAVMEAPTSDDDTVMETQAAISGAMIAYRQVEGSPSLLRRLLDALDKVRSAALSERQ